MSWVISKALEQYRSAEVESWGRCLSPDSGRPSGLLTVSRDYSFKELESCSVAQNEFCNLCSVIFNLLLNFFCVQFRIPLKSCLIHFQNEKTKTQRKGLDVPQVPEMQLKSSEQWMSVLAFLCSRLRSGGLFQVIAEG